MSAADMPVNAVTAPALREKLLAGGDLALLDLREEGTFGDGHILLAVPAPLSRLEMVIDDLVPRKSAPIVLTAAGDGDDDLIERGAERLKRFGYTDVSYLRGGLAAWAAAGFEVFTGVNVPSKAFGEVVETRLATPHVTADELKTMQDAGDDIVLLDSRPMAEFEAMSIPGGIDVPGAELVLRVHDLAPDPATTVVVNCAGRTRSIIGAQSLINAGVPNRVMALENGTMGWHLAGFQLETGQTRRFPDVSAAGLAKARVAAERVAARFGVPTVDAATLAEWRADDGRTTYLLDVRDPAEFDAGHLEGAKPAPGGQLVQATDRFIGVRGARVVLTDDNGVRATMTASWLKQMGWDVHVLEGALDAGPVVEGPHEPFVPGLEDARPETVTPKALAALMLGGGAIVVDLADSRAHRKGHVPGSRFAIRANLPGNLGTIAKKAKIALTSPDGRLALLAAADAARSGRDVLALDGGTAAWREAGLPLGTGFIDPLDLAVDVWYRPYDLYEGTEAAMREYLAWEIDLAAKIARDGTAGFEDPAGGDAGT